MMIQLLYPDPVTGKAITYELTDREIFESEFWSLTYRDPLVIAVHMN